MIFNKTQHRVFMKGLPKGGLTLVATAAGISNSDLSKYIRGHRPFTDEMLGRLVSARAQVLEDQAKKTIIDNQKINAVL